jgi:hypothetical protein
LLRCRIRFVLRGWTETMEFELAEDVLYARGR